MSDVTVAPNASPSPSPAANEVVINPNPTSAPNPVGSQAPDKPVGDIEGSKHRPESRREAIQRAFDRARDPDRPKPEPAKPRIGHNQPPEPMEREKLDLKKRPADQPQRAEHGHFAPREQNGAQQARPAAQQSSHNNVQPGQQGQAQQTARQLPDTARYRDPPPRMTERAKGEWHTTPESVRADVHRMHTEFAAGFNRYRNDHETMKTLRSYERMAKEHGTTLERALNNYVSMENKLRSDVVGGLDIIVSNLNLRTPEGQKLGLRDLAYHILNQSPEQHKLMQNQNAQAAQSQQIGQLHQMVSTLATGIKQMQYERQFSNTRTALDRFADDGKHPRFDELADLIEQEIKLGFDIDTAYARADRLRPATHAAQTRTNGNGNGVQRTVDRSIHGAPDAGPSNGTSKRNGGKPVGRREAIASAIKRVNGSL